MASDGTDAALEELMSFTGLGVDEARILLDAAYGQLEHAVALHFDAQDSSAASHPAHNNSSEREVRIWMSILPVFY